MTLFVLMGVSGSGKSTVGQCVATSLAVPFLEGDDYHPASNVQKMASGIPLDDHDRIAWIDALIAAVNEQPEVNVIVACSALTEFVRAKIKAQSRRPVCFVHLTADSHLIAQRLEHRGPHYMKPGMLPSQLAALQPTSEAFEVDTTPGIDVVCREVTSLVKAHASP